MHHTTEWARGLAVLVASKALPDWPAVARARARVIDGLATGTYGPSYQQAIQELTTWSGQVARRKGGR
jgi:hypothetical protein